MIMYISNIARAAKSCMSMKSETLPLKTITNKLDFLKKAVIIHSNG